jgi:hypothetical protein
VARDFAMGPEDFAFSLAYLYRRNVKEVEEDNYFHQIGTVS